MKKLIISGLMVLAISSTGFARMHEDGKMDRKPTPSNTHKMKEYSSRRNPDLERAQILIEEKKLEVRKELLNDNPDWNKIEKLNIEIATQEAKNRTCHMRERFETKFDSQNKKNN